MVSVLALNKLELKDMINAEMVENPVLEELEDAVPLLDERRPPGRRTRSHRCAGNRQEKPVADEKKDPFEEIDFGSFFQDYLDPGYRSRGEMEEIEKPSFENFFSKPGNLTNHCDGNGAISVSRQVHDAAEVIIGNLSEDGYLIASDEELLGITPPAPPAVDVQKQANIVVEAQAIGIPAEAPGEPEASSVTPEYDDAAELLENAEDDAALDVPDEVAFQADLPTPESEQRRSLHPPRLLLRLCRSSPPTFSGRTCTRLWKSFASSIRPVSPAAIC